MHPDLRGRIVGLLDYTETDESDGIAEDPYGHGTHVAGIIAGSGNASDGNYTGVAPSSLLIIQRVFNDSGGWEGPENLTVLFSDSKNLGAQIVSNSWGRWSWGEYTDLDKEADEAVRNYSLIIIFAAGNDGPYMESTLSPSNAKNVISVGASENNKTLNATYGGSYWDNPNEVASFSSRGPTNDKRVKPDLVAPGTAILSTKSSLAPDYYYGGVVEGNGGDYGYLMGTSQAAPHVAGAAAIILEYFNKTFGFFPSPALVKALLINGAEDMGYGYPSYKQGWGRLNIKNSIIENETRKIIFKEENTSISTENYSAFKFFVQNNSMLKITLVWTDWPGDPAAEKALVNDLDLFVLTPSGYMRRGNDFSFPYDDEKDDRNNVENVFINISEIEEGNYTVVVYGYNIPMEPQKFALVLSGNLTEVEMLPDEDVFPPAIWDVTPGNNQTTIGEVEIRANVTDNIEVSKVWIEYSNDTMNWDVSEMSFNGEIYSGSLNVTSEGTWIYRVLANDTSSKISSSRFYSLWTEEPRKIFVVRSMGTSPYDLNNMPWEKLNNNWFNYGLKPIVINYTFLNIPKITYENLTESKADVLLIASAYDQFTYSEIEAIKRYTKEGHGLIATGRTLWYIIPNNNKLAPLFGMREDLSYTYTYFSYINLLNQNHPIFRNIPLNYSPNYPLSCVPSDYSWNESDLVRGTFISLSDNNVSAIIVNKYKNVSYITHMPEYYSSEYDIQLLYNALTWSNYTPEQHDLEVEWIKINKPYVRPNENFTLEAKISNYGIENETNISVMFLVNGTNVENKTINLSSMESTQVYFNYSNSSTGIFNLSVYVFGNESETLLENNVLSKFIMITNADVILVDDDRASYYETYYEQALKDNGIDYVLWDSSKFGTPPNSTLMDFNITIWFTGNDWITTLTSDEISSIKDFLDNGGNLFISGQDIGYYLYYSNYPFYRNYFHSKYMRDDSGILKIEGMEGDGIGDGLVFDIHGGDGANNQIWPDEIEPYDEFANPIFKYFQNGYAGIRAQTLKYNLIYLAFGFEGINNSQDRKEIMNRSINFFYKYLYDKPPITFLDCPNYTYYTNSQPIWLNLTAIDDFKLENATLYGNFTGNWQKNETIFISNNTENGTALNLAEGVYIWNYLVYDNSSFYDWGNKNCTLIVDRTLPIISSVSASPSYTYATISWQTN
ncbi:MAG: S8 family serine peptidase, partial [Candidatus Aenigmatarchaeota archaeon]